MKWCDMYQEVCCNRGTEAGGGELMWATQSAPPVILCLLRAWYVAILEYGVWDIVVVVEFRSPRSKFVSCDKWLKLERVH